MGFPLDVQPAAGQRQPHVGSTSVPCLPAWLFGAEEINNPGDLFTFYFITLIPGDRTEGCLSPRLGARTRLLHLRQGRPPGQMGTLGAGEQEACCGPR